MMILLFLGTKIDSRVLKRFLGFSCVWVAGQAHGFLKGSVSGTVCIDKGLEACSC